MKTNSFQPHEWIGNWINGCEEASQTSLVFDKINPATGQLLCRVTRSDKEDIDRAVRLCREKQPAWAAKTVVSRGDILREIALLMRSQRSWLAQIVHLETGKSMKDALSETDAAIEMGLFVAGEGRRYYGRTSTSAVANRTALVMRQPLGVAGLIIPANTPIANVAWKAFPALLCGNSAVCKAAEDTPLTAWAFGKLASEAGLPDGVLSTVQGLGEEAGAPLAAHPGVDIVSFTGSCKAGRSVHQAAGSHLAKICLELGGKNPLVVCDDADLELALKWSLLSAFSNAGQRCAAGSRILVFSSIYDTFKKRFVDATKQLRLGIEDEDDMGPVINKKQLDNMLIAVHQAQTNGAVILTGGQRLIDPGHNEGFYMAPTILENVSAQNSISRTELFGPITCLYRVSSFDEAIALANDSPYGLTAAIHTRNMNRAMAFVHGIQSGVVSINGGTYGSEPHMPFGGLKQSGNGLREAGTEALDVYSDWKTVYINHNPADL
jgi:aldehyde dehydrogenase (NAD+)